jgi:hypothetical protein
MDGASFSANAGLYARGGPDGFLCREKALAAPGATARWRESESRRRIRKEGMVK